MSEEMPEKSGTSLQLSERQTSFLAGIIVAAAVLTLMLIVAMIGLLAYGIFSGSSIALIGSLFCLAGCLLLIGLSALIFRGPRMQKRRETASGSGREAYTKAREELSAHYQLAQEEKKRKRRETYLRVKEELSARYNRAKHGEY